MTDYRFDKIDDAIQRLAGVAADLSKMMAVHEQRISQQEKASDNIVAYMEKRRNEVDDRIKDIYDTIRVEIKTAREAASNEHTKQNARIEEISKSMYMAIGGVTLLGWIISAAAGYLKVFH